MKHHIRTGIAGLLIAAVAAPAAFAADVTVRAEGFFGTVLPQTTVSNTGPNALRNGKSCPTPADTGRSAAGALERATAGNWDGGSFSFGLTVERIGVADLGSFPAATTYWNFDVNNVSQQVGICDVAPAAGDELLFYEACASQGETDCFTGKPLGLTAPATATAGEPFTVTVVEFDDFASTPKSAPAGGATVTAGDASATTDANGRATLTVGTSGKVTVVAAKARQVRDSAVVDVKPVVYEVPTPTPTPTPTAAPDTVAPVSRIKRIADGRKYKRSDGPRELRVRVEEAGDLRAVKFSLTRRAKGRCTGFKARSERFEKISCGSRPRFLAGKDKHLSYLLPSRLGTGRYVLIAVAIDSAGNRDAIERGRNKVVFRVR